MAYNSQYTGEQVDKAVKIANNNEQVANKLLATDGEGGIKYIAENENLTFTLANGSTLNYDGSVPASVNSIRYAGLINFTTSAPTAANPSGLGFVVLTSEPATRYAGWIYIITEE